MSMNRSAVQEGAEETAEEGNPARTQLDLLEAAVSVLMCPIQLLLPWALQPTSGPLTPALVTHRRPSRHLKGPSSSGGAAPAWLWTE